MQLTRYISIAAVGLVVLQIGQVHTFLQKIPDAGLKAVVL